MTKRIKKTPRTVASRGAMFLRLILMTPEISGVGGCFRRFLDGSGGRFKVSNFNVQNFSAERKRPVLESASTEPYPTTMAPSASKYPPCTKLPSGEPEVGQEGNWWGGGMPRARGGRKVGGERGLDVGEGVPAGGGEKKKRGVGGCGEGFAEVAIEGEGGEFL